MAHILLVDDDPQIRRVIETILSLENHEVCCASDGSEALQLIQQVPFDLVITDLIMPETEGLAMIREVRKTHPALYIIAMTGGGYGSAAEYLSWARALGVQQTLAKPFSRDEIVAAVAEAFPKA
jgi:two-component system response regulator AtoC